MLRVLVAVVVVLGLAGPGLAQSKFATPEAAVTAYVEAIAARDFRAVMASTAVDEMSQGFDFVGMVGWLGALTGTMQAPASDPFLVGINRATLSAQIARQLQFLTYGLLTTSEVANNMVVQMDGAAAAALAAQLNGARLAGIVLLGIGVPNPSIQTSERHQANLARNAALWGAEAATDRIALIGFEGRHFALGFGLMQFGGHWKINTQTSPLAGFPAFGTPAPTTPEGFAEMIR